MMIRRAVGLGVAMLASPVLVAFAFPATPTTEPAAVAGPAVAAEVVAAAPVPLARRPAASTVPAGVVAGLAVVTDLDHDPDGLYYATYPRVPGAAAWDAAFVDLLDEAVDRFERVPARADAGTSPELQVTHELVAASPAVLGARVVMREVHGEDDVRRTATLWFDSAAGVPVEPSTLLTPDGPAVLADRVRRAARSDEVVDPALLDRSLPSPTFFDALAFGPDGDLVVELDQGAVADAPHGPVTLAVDPAGVLSSLGEAALAASTAPSDPGLDRPPPPPLPPPPPPAAPPPAPPDAAGVDCAVLRCVALTFDDGPVAETVDVLAALEQRGARATFFVVGQNAASSPDLLRRMVAGGHAVGGHSWDHPDLTRLSADQVRAQLGRTSQAIERATGAAPTLTRPPYGATGPTVAAAAAAAGVAQVLWDVDPRDWRDRNADVVAQRVVAAARPGSIVLLHDIHPSTRAAVPRIVDALQAGGYTLVTVPELLPTTQPGRTYSRR